MNNPEKVRVVMDELCEEMATSCLCIEVCELCPLSTIERETISRITKMFDNEL
jgi:hypothetical protein